MHDHGSNRTLTRRVFLGASAALSGGLVVPGTLQTAAGEERTVAVVDSDQQVHRLRSQLFTGPISSRIDLGSLDPHRRPSSTQLGAIGQFDRQFVERYPWMTQANMLPFAVAAGIKWVRTGLVYEDWDWQRNRPTESLRAWVGTDLRAGVKPLFTVNNNSNVGTGLEVSGAVDLIRAAIAEWGVDVGAFMLSNEPGNFVWKQHYGGDYSGGPWVERYSRFVEQVSTQIKAEHPQVTLVNAMQVEQMAMTQLKTSMPRIDALCMHHYTYRLGLPPEYNSHAADPKFADFASSDTDFERTMADYLRQGKMLLDDDRLELWMTEVGIPSRSNREFAADTLEPMSQAQQAKTLARMLVLGMLNVTKTFVYSLMDQGHSPTRDNDNYGLVDDQLNPKPAFFVLGRVSALTGGRVTRDPDFQAVPIRMGASSLPMYVREVGDSLTVRVKEQIRAERLTTADGTGVVAIWSTAPVREKFVPHRVTFAFNHSLRGRPLLVDPLTGSSRFAAARRTRSGSQMLTVDVPDYPVFLVDGP